MERRMTKITEVRSDPITGEYDVVDIFSYELIPMIQAQGEFVKLNNISDRLKDTKLLRNPCKCT